MCSILERERAEMVIERWVRENRKKGARIEIEAVSSGAFDYDAEFDFGVSDEGGIIDGVRAESWAEGIQLVARIILDIY